MSHLVLILRPQPGAEESAKRAVALGLDPVVAPLFTLLPLDWNVPEEGGLSAMLLTSANAARLAGPGLDAFTHLPCYAVGEATAAAARAAGCNQVRVGPADMGAALALMAKEGVKGALHLCGRDHVALGRSEFSLTRRLVYAAESVDALSPAAVTALERGALVLLHSARAASLFAGLVQERAGVRLAAISAAVADTAGEGWGSRHVAPVPRDDALLELAAQLCQTTPPA